VSILRTIAAKIKGQDCERIVKTIGNEVSLSLPTLELAGTSINVGTFSNRIIELQRASIIATALDNSQYLICRLKGSTSDRTLRKNCEKIYLQILLALTQLESIFEAIKLDPNPKNRKELADWIKFCGSLNKHAIETISPGISGKGPAEHEIGDIMRFQNITEADMNEALDELEH